MKQPMEKALQIAEENLKEIRTVAEWAEKMGYGCPKMFSRKFRNHYGERPKSQLIKVRLGFFFKLIKENQDMGCYEISLKIGCIDEIALSKFIKSHTGKSPNEWRRKIDP